MGRRLRAIGRTIRRRGGEAKAEPSVLDRQAAEIADGPSDYVSEAVA